MVLITAGIGAVACGSKNEETTSSVQKEGGKEIIVDVRTPEEWKNDGHADCTVNYPLDQLEGKLEELKKYDKVTFVCRSGHRAGIAESMLKDAGMVNVKNAGAWQNINCR